MLQHSLQPRFGYRLAVLARRWRAQVDAELETFGLSQATWRPLLYLISFEGVPRQRDLAEALQIGCPALVRLLDNLEEKRLIERVDVDDDRRAKQIKLTSEGRRIAKRVHAIIVEIERKLLSELSSEDLANCERAFSAIENQLDTYQADP
jgi:MarR family transcriptional regulator for hemolysin